MLQINKMEMRENSYLHAEHAPTNGIVGFNLS